MTTLAIYPRDLILVACMIVMIGSVLWNWHEYRACKHPLQVWLIVDLVGILMFRINQWVFQIASSLRNRSRYTRYLPAVVAFFNLYVLYPFLWIWCAIGCVWYNQSSKCLPPEMSGFSFISWIAFTYLYLVSFGAVLYGTYRMRLRARRMFEENANWSQEELEQFLIQFQEAQAFALTPAVGGIGFAQGLSPEELDAIPERAVTGTEIMPNGDDMDLRCSICLEELQPGELYRLLKCEHIFHTACLDQWLAIKANCAKCRQRITVPGAEDASSERTPLLGHRHSPV